MDQCEAITELDWYAQTNVWRLPDIFIIVGSTDNLHYDSVATILHPVARFPRFTFPIQFQAGVGNVASGHYKIVLVFMNQCKFGLESPWKPAGFSKQVTYQVLLSFEI